MRFGTWQKSFYSCIHVTEGFKRVFTLLFTRRDARKRIFSHSFTRSSGQKSFYSDLYVTKGCKRVLTPWFTCCSHAKEFLLFRLHSERRQKSFYSYLHASEDSKRVFTPCFTRFGRFKRQFQLFLRYAAVVSTNSSNFRMQPGVFGAKNRSCGKRPFF